MKIQKSRSENDIGKIYNVDNFIFIRGLKYS